MLQCVAVCCSVLQCGFRVLQCVAVCCSVVSVCLQYVARDTLYLVCVTTISPTINGVSCGVLQSVAVCCSVLLQCVAVCCSMLQCVSRERVLCAAQFVS